MEINEKLKVLAGSVATHGELLQESEVSHLVLLAAVLAMARTHPDPKRFANEFRQSWLLLGSPQQFAEAGSPPAVRIDEWLDMIEEALGISLAVRPPRE
jgi:hypothetical protein